MFGIPLHVLLVHFPIVFMVAAVFCDLRGTHNSGYRLTLWSSAGVVVAILTGLLLTGGSMSAVTTHAGAGIVGGVVTLVFGMLRYSHRVRQGDTNVFISGWFAVELLALLGIVVAAITGHRVALGK
jgi:uncharacterized membrane protein